MEHTHIFNVASIAKRVKEKVDERNVYEKVNQIFKGANTGSPRLRIEVIDILRKQAEEFISMIEGEGEPLAE